MPKRAKIVNILTSSIEGLQEISSTEFEFEGTKYWIFNPFWKKKTSKNMQSKKINRSSEASQVKKEGYSIRK